MRAILKRLILAFVILSFVKIILSFLISTPTMFGDEYLYSSMARSFYKNFNFITYGTYSQYYGPIYPMVLSIAYIFKNMVVVYSVFKILGAFLSSLIIFPVWLLAKEFLNERKAFLIAILCGVLPFSFIFSFFVLADNLFYSLVIFTIYFLYKSFTDKNLRWDFLTGLFLGLCYLTKMLGIALIFAIFIILIINLINKRNFSQVKRKIFLYFIALLTVLPWLIRNGKIYGWSFNGIIGGYSQFYGISFFLLIGSIGYWFLTYLVYLLLATGIIVFLFNLFKPEKEKEKLFLIITWVCIICFSLISAVFNSYLIYNNKWSGILLGRYVESIIPLMIILCFVNLKFKDKFEEYKSRFVIASMISIALAFKIFYFNLFPVNATSLSYGGLIKVGIQYLLPNMGMFIVIGLFVLLPLYLFLIKYLRFRKLFYSLVIFFVLVNIVAFGMIYFNSNYRWEPLDQMQLGLWFNENVDSTNANVLFDDSDSKEIHEYDIDISDVTKIVERPMKPMAFWMNANIKIGDAIYAKDFDYVVSRDNLDYNLLKEVGDFKLYEV